MPNLQPPMQRGQQFMMPQYTNKQSINSMAYKTWGGIIVSIEPISKRHGHLQTYLQAYRQKTQFALISLCIMPGNAGDVSLSCWSCRARASVWRPSMHRPVLVTQRMTDCPSPNSHCFLHNEWCTLSLLRLVHPRALVRQASFIGPLTAKQRGIFSSVESRGGNRTHVAIWSIQWNKNAKGNNTEYPSRGVIDLIHRREALCDGDCIIFLGLKIFVIIPWILAKI